MGTRRVKGSIPLKFLELEEVQDVTGMEEIITSMKEIRGGVVEVALGDEVRKGGRRVLEDGGNCRRIA